MRFHLPLLASTLLALSTMAVQGQQTVTFNYVGAPLPIVPTADAEIFTIARVFVPLALEMSKVTARVQISYPQVGDLNVFLFSPAGTRTKLLERNCGSLRNVNVNFDDTAGQRFADFCPSESSVGTFQGNEPLGNFNGQSSIGTWRLAVQNNGGNSNVGYILNFGVTITGTNQLVPSFSADTVVNEASLVSGPVAPGERVAIFGTGLGPIVGVSAPAGNLPTTLGGTTVSINGTPIPIAYASALVSIAQIPYTVTASSMTMTVNYNNLNSTNVTVNVRPESPAIYPVAAGDGRAKVINQDGTQNSRLAPASPGSYVTLYANGLGAVTTPPAAGTVTPDSPLSTVIGTGTVYVGGVPATVTFAGLAPGLIGIYQVNLMISEQTPSGTQPILIVSSNGVASQDQLFLEIE